MRFGSVCSGIEAASVAWEPLGWQAAWFSEIEPFPCAVLQHHYPAVPNHGDMTALPERIRSGEVEAPDMLCGGTPCQAFSIAGLRRSLDDDRGNLTLTFVEIADAIDAVRFGRGEQPAIIFWENVPGVLNTNDNAFGCFLGALAGETMPLEPPGKRWTDAGVVSGPQRTIAWRVLDAQHFGVAQRRKRVFLVASARDDIDCAAILFESEGVRRDFAPSRKARQEPATSARASTASSSNREPSFTLSRMVGFGDYVQDEMASAIKARDWKDATDLVCCQADIHAFDARQSDVLQYGNLSGPLDTDGHSIAIAFDTTQITHPANRSTPKDGEPCHPLAAGAHAPAIAFERRMVRTSGGQPQVELNHCLRADENTGDGAPCVATFQQTSFTHHGTMGYDTTNVAKPVKTQADGQMLQSGLQVRRLTPRECERLQGFPDDYTLIPFRNKPAAACPDGPRYKAIGNSWAVPVVRWIGRRIDSSR